MNRGGCNEVAAGVVPHNQVDPYSYVGSIKGSGGTIDLRGPFYPLISTLDGSAQEVTLGPVTIALPATRSVTKYKLRQSMQGYRPDTAALATDKDSASITCIEP
jgi:hypothetical protein